MRTTTTKIIGQNLQKLRVQNGFTRQDLSTFLNVSYQQIQKYETGANRLPIENLYRLQQLYNAPFTAFFLNISQTELQTAADLPDDLKILKQYRILKNKKLKQKITKIITIMMS